MEDDDDEHVSDDDDEEERMDDDGNDGNTSDAGLSLNDEHFTTTWEIDMDLRKVCGCMGFDTSDDYLLLFVNFYFCLLIIFSNPAFLT
jgi:hypothetical protein